MNLDGCVTIVTGASSGIGESTALHLAQRGGRLVLAARREERLHSLAERIRSETSGEAEVVACDVTDPDQTQNLAHVAKVRFSRIDALVNNAGIMPLSPIDQGRVDEWHRMVDVNIKGVLNVCHACLPILLSQGQGHILNVSSVAGRIVFANGTVYCATKHFVHAFSEGLRAELGSKGIRVSTIAPGYVATELQDSIKHNQTREGLLQMYADVEVLQSEDVARAVVYALEQPDHVSVNEILLRPTAQQR